MISLTFKQFMDGDYEEGESLLELYVVRNGDDCLYIGISQSSIWHRWFRFSTGHIRRNVFGEYFPSTPIAEAIISNMPASLEWQIELWTAAECYDFLKDDLTGIRVTTKENIKILEPFMVKHLKPFFNSSYNNTEISQASNIAVTQQYAHLSDDELDQGYEEIFNK